MGKITKYVDFVDLMIDKKENKKKIKRQKYLKTNKKNQLYKNISRMKKFF